MNNKDKALLRESMSGTAKEKDEAIAVFEKMERETQEFVKNDPGDNLERDLRENTDLRKRLADDDDLSIRLYGGLCNVEWWKDERRFSFSWRYAGGLVADLRDKDEYYLDFYCSGGEGIVTDDVREIMGEMGWTPKILDALEDV